LRQATHKSIKANNTAKTICQKIQFVPSIKHKKLISRLLYWRRKLSSFGCQKAYSRRQGLVFGKTGCEETTIGKRQRASLLF